MSEGTKQLKVIYQVETSDIKEQDLKQAEKCEKALGAWFEAQSINTQLAIFYAYTSLDVIDFNEFDILEHCPWCKLMERARDDILKKHMPKGVYDAKSNLFLYPIKVTCR